MVMLETVRMQLVLYMIWLAFLNILALYCLQEHFCTNSSDIAESVP